MYRVDYNKILLYSKGNYIRHPIKHKGKEYEKEYTHTHTHTYIYFWINLPETNITLSINYTSIFKKRKWAASTLNYISWIHGLSVFSYQNPWGEGSISDTSLHPPQPWKDSLHKLGPMRICWVFVDEWILTLDPVKLPTQSVHNSEVIIGNNSFISISRFQSIS